jgi:copper oxidase (laccase) domain-containing protein
MSGAKHWLTPDWPAPANIHSASTLRTGGASSGAYASLNPAMHVGDDVDQVKQNRQIIKDLLHLPGEPVWLDQVHGNRAVQAGNPPLPPFAKEGDLQQADASYTTEAGIVCAVMTADCLPLLVCTTDGTRVAAIHAGWRGLLAGVIGNTLAAMQILLDPSFSKGEVSQFCNPDLVSKGGSDPLCNSDLVLKGLGKQSHLNPPLYKRGARGDFLVWLGPAIGPDCFEVGSEVRKAFLDKSEAFEMAFKQQNNGQWLADIYQLARIDLVMLGIDKVYGGEFCTVTDHERFYSYRRDKETGRMATLIWRT